MKAIQRFDHGFGAEIGTGKNQALAHACNVGAGIQVGEGFAGSDEFVNAFQYRVARDNGDFCVESEFASAGPLSCCSWYGSIER